MHPGTQQDERLAQALQGGYFLPDELSLDQRLRLTVALARRLHFSQLGGQQRGHWDQALMQDPSFWLAELAGWPVEEAEAQLLQSERPLDEASTLALRQALRGQLQQWRRALDGLACGAAAPLADEPGGLPLREAQQGLLAHLDQVLKVLRPEPEPDGAGLRQTGLALCRVIRKLRETALAALPASLNHGRHDPAMGLLLAFNQLLQASRAALNEFPERYTKFYYHQLLGQQLAGAEPDRIHVLLQRDPRHTKPVLLARGSRLSCGMGPTGQARVYAVEQDLALGSLRVDSLLTLRLEADRLISPEREFGFATRAKSCCIVPPSPDQAALPDALNWPLLGGSRSPQAQDAELGLAVSSPLLALAEGEREIVLDLLLMHPSESAPSLAELLARAPEQRNLRWLYRVYRLLAVHEQRCQGERASWLDSRDERHQLLRLAHWRRSYTLRQPWLGYLLLRCLQTRDAERFSQRLGRLFAVWLCLSDEVLDKHALDALYAQTRKCLPHLRLDKQALTALRKQARERGPMNLHELYAAADNPLVMILGQRRRKGRQQLERALVFDRIWRGVWEANLSEARGWYSLGNVYTSPLESGGLRVRLLLSAGAPAICACNAAHGAQWLAAGPHPVLQLRLRGQTRMFSVSLLQQLELSSLRLQVRVQGARQLLLYNQLGRLDPSKPFQPFGPLPDSAAYLVFSHAELASKPLDELQLQPLWAGLPDSLIAHYQGYPEGPWHAGAFTLQSSILCGGRWRPSHGQALPLFAGALNLPSSDLRGDHQAAAPDASKPLAYDTDRRQGFFKLALAERPQGFGHALYPRLLTETLTRNTQRNTRAKGLRHAQEPLPNQPYTPLLELLNLSYTSSERLSLQTPAELEANAAAASRVLHITPFGLQPLAGSQGPVHVLPPWAARGQLFIGLGGGGDAPPSGLLHLLFQLRAAGAREALGAPPVRLQWAAWCGAQGWLPLGMQRVSVDQTQGMLRSGLVVLDLPDGMTSDCPAMPPGLLWLRLSADGDLERLAPLQGVWAQAVSAVALQPEAGAGQALPPHSLKSCEPPLAGVLTMLQPQPSFGLRAAEDEAALRTRVSERLRHRQRACTPWDYERLVLQAFPEVFKVKCMPQRPRGGAPGQVLVVVVPASPSVLAGQDGEASEAPRLDAATLAQIQAHLQARSAPGTRLLVRNAGYERVQVRAGLQLQSGYQHGERLRELNQLLSDYLSPWRPDGLSASFDWQLGIDEVEALLRAQPGVEAVSQVSLLHIVRSDRGVYRLLDSARGKRQSIRPAYRWSLALPMRQHILSVLSQRADSEPQTTGLSLLRVGSNFIISGQRP